MATSRFKNALGGKLIRGRVDFAAEAGPAVVDIRGFSGLGPNDYSLAGAPLGREQDTVQLVAAHNAEDYSITIKGQTFTFTSGGAATVTTIRDGLLALFTAPVLASLGISATSSGVDSIDFAQNEAGAAEELATAVTADTPADITISARVGLGVAGVPLCCVKRSGQMVFRSTATITAGVEFAVVG
jgi:hypothetical protein